MLAALLLSLGLVACKPSGPGIQRCVAWWNDPNNQSYRRGNPDVRGSSANGRMGRGC
jgi:hypothetical protein